MQGFRIQNKIPRKALGVERASVDSAGTEATQFDYFGISIQREGEQLVNVECTTRSSLRRELGGYDTCSGNGNGNGKYKDQCTQAFKDG